MGTMIIADGEDNRWLGLEMVMIGLELGLGLGLVLG
jgi:hypothetical protein